MEGITWAQLSVVVGSATGLLGALLTWLHVRVNDVKKDQKEDYGKLNDSINALKVSIVEAQRDRELLRQEILTVVQSNFTPKNEMGAKLDLLSERTQSVNDRICDFLALHRDVITKVDRMAERLAVVEGKVDSIKKQN